MAEAPSGTVTILFTDIAASTSLTERFGDAEFRGQARELDTLLRTAISEGEGRAVEGKLLGDGVLAVFSSAGRAIECAVRCCALAEERGLPLHIGLHVGDVLHEGDDVFGGAVNLAARICAASAAGEVLVSDTVRSLARTSVAVQFEDRGQHTLKGIADSLRLFAVLPKEPGVDPFIAPTGLRKLWASGAFRVAAALLLLGVIGGGVVGGIFVSGVVGGGGSPAGAEYRKLEFHIGAVQLTYQIVSGDCETSDLFMRATLDEPVVLSGDFAGHITLDSEATLYLSDSCEWGLASGAFTQTDQGGNTLSGTYHSVISLLGFTEQGPRPLGGQLASVVTGGSGVYQGARGHGRCSVTSATTGGNVVGEADCISQITPGGIAPEEADPVLFELGAGVTKMAVFTSPLDLAKKAYFSVLYFNPGDEALAGLSLKLGVPEGTEMRAAERDEEAAAAGERVWALPDLAPGALGSFQFSVTFLSAESDTVDLVAEIDGDGFDRPVRTAPLEIEIVQ
ncbi:MAG: adenylate/guanylate cyclase domain-containing protein [Dehalococcoidia bacterium]